MLERTRRVALLIDYDNLQICATRDTPGRDLQLEPVVHLAQKYGTVIVARAYAEWNLSTERLAVYKAGIEPAFAPVLRTENDRTGKSLADTVMVAEGMDILWTQFPDTIVLATSDKDLIPLVRVAKQRGARVVVVGSDLTAIPLREMADEHVTYKQLINDAALRYGEFVPGRGPLTPPEPVRRAQRTDREREREVRPREPREPRASAPAPVIPSVAPAPPAAIPVAPVIPSLPTADVDGLGRRRRRRGSRRRGERMPGDELGIGEEGSEQEEVGSDGLFGDEAEAPAGVFEESVEPLPMAMDEEPILADAPLEPDVEPEPVELEPTLPEIATAEEPNGMEETPVVLDVEPAVEGETAAPNGVDHPATAEETDGEEAAAEDAAPKRTRTRRVASASHGRTRRTTR